MFVYMYAFAVSVNELYTKKLQLQNHFERGK